MFNLFREKLFFSSVVLISRQPYRHVNNNSGACYHPLHRLHYWRRRLPQYTTHTGSSSSIVTDLLHVGFEPTHWRIDRIPFGMSCMVLTFDCWQFQETTRLLYLCAQIGRKSLRKTNDMQLDDRTCRGRHLRSSTGTN